MVAAVLDTSLCLRSAGISHEDQQVSTPTQMGSLSTKHDCAKVDLVPPVITIKLVNARCAALCYVVLKKSHTGVCLRIAGGSA